MLNKRRNTECEFLYYVEVSLCEHWEVLYQNGIHAREQQGLELFRWKHAKGERTLQIYIIVYVYIL